MYNTSNFVLGWLGTSGAYPTTNSSYPNAKYWLLELKQGQSVTISLSSVFSQGKLRCIDKATNVIIGNIENASNSYYTSTASYSGNWLNGTITANKDIILGFLALYGPPTTNNVQIEYGTTATTYEPYTEQTQLLPLGNIELAKIGTYTDRIFKAVQGNTIYDSLDSTTKASLTVGKWYKQRNIGKATYVGANTEGWTLSTTKTITQVFSTVKGDAPSGAQPCLTNMFTDNVTGDVEVAKITGKTFYVAVNKTRASTVNEFKEWLSSHNLLLYFQLLTPTYTEITDTTLLAQLENILAMHTNKNVTNISIVPTGTNAEPTGEWEYRVDLGTVIGNINNAIISLGGNV